MNAGQKVLFCKSKTRVKLVRVWKKEVVKNAKQNRSTVKRASGIPRLVAKEGRYILMEWGFKAYFLTGG